MPPALIVGGAAAAAAAAGGIAGAIGKVGKNTHQSSSFEESKFYDPNATKYGGSATGLQDYNARLAQGGAAADARGANLANYDQANAWGQQGQAWDAQSQQARAQQGQAANMMMQRAQGATPSIAQMQGDRQMQQAAAAQASAAASARGPAAMALSQQNAASNTANAQGAIAGQTQINAAQERMQAEQNAFGAASGMRGGDQASQQNAVQQQQQAAQQQQFQAGQQQQNRNANDARAMGYENLTGAANTASMNAENQNQATLANSYNEKEKLEASRAQANANNEKGWFSTIFKSDENAKEALPMSALMDGGGGAAGSAGGYAAMAGMLSDTQAKKSALLQQGQQQGMQLAQGGKGNADPAMLDDRQTQMPSYQTTDTVGKPALDQAIGAQAAQDKNDPTAQWQRSFGDASQATDDARKHDNMVAMKQTQDSFAADSGAEKSAQWTNWLDAFGFKSDSRAKEQAYEQGRSDAISAPVAPDGPSPLPPPRTPLPGRYNTKLEASVEQQFRAWKKRYAPNDSGDDYDLRGAFKAGQKPGPDGHWVDTYKKPNHETFSEESQYAKGADAKRAGRWDEDTYLPPGVPGNQYRLDPGKADGTPGEQYSLDASPVAQANRAMVGSPYAYKGQHTPPSQQQGEPNFGPMAQNLEKSPVAATAVKMGPEGLRVIDRDKMLKVVASGVADLQRQQDEVRMALRKGGR